jgi:D-alanine--poly(phosphoribitol) ligase subunit 2
MEALNLEKLTQLLRHYFNTHNKTLSDDFNSETDFFISGLLDFESSADFLIYIENLLDKEILLGDFTLAAIKNVNSIYDHYILG